MSREYLNNKYCVRCGRSEATPYLRKYVDLIKAYAPGGDAASVLDIGCGNGRNSEFMRASGFKTVASFDMKPDYGVAMSLGSDDFPAEDSSVGVVLANYVLMFLNQEERRQVLREIRRVAKPGCVLMIELYAAKDSECPDAQSLLELRDEIADFFPDWKRLRFSKERCILRAPTV